MACLGSGCVTYTGWLEGSHWMRDVKEGSLRAVKAVMSHYKAGLLLTCLINHAQGTALSSIRRGLSNIYQLVSRFQCI